MSNSPAPVSPAGDSTPRRCWRVDNLCVFGKPANAPDGPWRPEENRWWASRHKVDFDFFRFLPAIDCRECNLGRRETIGHSISNATESLESPAAATTALGNETRF